MVPPRRRPGHGRRTISTRPALRKRRGRRRGRGGSQAILPGCDRKERRCVDVQSRAHARSGARRPTGFDRGDRSFHPCGRSFIAGGTARPMRASARRTRRRTKSRECRRLVFGRGATGSCSGTDVVGDLLRAGPRRRAGRGARGGVAHDRRQSGISTGGQGAWRLVSSAAEGCSLPIRFTPTPTRARMGANRI